MKRLLLAALCSAVFMGICTAGYYFFKLSPIVASAVLFCGLTVFYYEELRK